MVKQMNMPFSYCGAKKTMALWEWITHYLLFIVGCDFSIEFVEGKYEPHKRSAKEHREKGNCNLTNSNYFGKEETNQADFWINLAD